MTSQRVGRVVLFLMAATAIGLLLPALQRVRAYASGQETAERIKRLALSLHACNDLHKSLPPAFDGFAGNERPASVHVHLLRFIEPDSGRGLQEGNVLAYQAPADASSGDGAGVQNFAANLRVFSDIGVQGYSGQFNPVPVSAVMPGKSAIPRTFSNGTSNTICFATKMASCTQAGATAGVGIDGGSRYAAEPSSTYAAFFGENAASVPAHSSNPAATFQLAPAAGDCRVWPLMAQSFDSRGIAVGLGDGSVRNIAANVAAEVWNCALQPNYYRGCGGCDW